MAIDFHWRRPLTIGQQIVGMQRLFGQLKPAIRRNSVRWTGPLVPHEAGVPYDVRILYKLGDFPKTWISGLILADERGQSVPHMYKDGAVCLNLPAEWNPRQLISHTIVPWISHWLLHYEVWLSTGEWLGGGLHPPRSARSR
jgi:hypothetical protein